jgi:hypothetical protein
MRLSTVQIIQHQTIGKIITNEMERGGRKQLRINFRYYPGICVQALWKPWNISSGSPLFGPKTGTQDLLNMKDCYSFWLYWLVKITLNPLKDSPPLDWYKTWWSPDNILDVVENKQNVEIHLSSYQTLMIQCTRRQFTHKNNSHPCLLVPRRHLKWVDV